MLDGILIRKKVEEPCSVPNEENTDSVQLQLEKLNTKFNAMVAKKGGKNPTIKNAEILQFIKDKICLINELEEA